MSDKRANANASSTTSAVSADPSQTGLSQPREIKRLIEAGALVKFARATGQSDPIFTGMETQDSHAGYLVASPTYVGTFCEVVGGVFLPHPDYNMFLHSADATVNFEPIRPGDLITATAELIEVAHKVGSHGPTLVQRGLVTLTNQHGRTVSTVEVEMRSFNAEMRERNGD